MFKTNPEYLITKPQRNITHDDDDDVYIFNVQLCCVYAFVNPQVKALTDFASMNID